MRAKAILVKAILVKAILVKAILVKAIPVKAILVKAILVKAIRVKAILVKAIRVRAILVKAIPVKILAKAIRTPTKVGKEMKMTYRLSIAAALILMLTAPALAADQSTPPNSAATGSDPRRVQKNKVRLLRALLPRATFRTNPPRELAAIINRRKGTEFSSSWISGSNRPTTGQR